MKKALAVILAIVCLVAVFMTGAENPGGSPDIWNFVALAVAGLSGYGLKKQEEAR